MNLHRSRDVSGSRQVVYIQFAVPGGSLPHLAAAAAFPASAAAAAAARGRVVHFQGILFALEHVLERPPCFIL